MHCMSCGRVYIRPDDYDPTKHSVVGAPAAAPVSTPSATPSTPSTAPVSTPSTTSSTITSSATSSTTPAMTSPTEERPAAKRPRNTDGSDFPAAPATSSATATTSSAYPPFRFNYDEGEEYFRDDASPGQGGKDDDEEDDKSTLLRETQVVNKAVAVLLAKLETTTDRIQRTSNDPALERELCDLVSASVNALNALKQLKTQGRK